MKNKKDIYEKKWIDAIKCFLVGYTILEKKYNIEKNTFKVTFSYNHIGITEELPDFLSITQIETFTKKVTFNITNFYPPEKLREYADSYKK